MGNGTWQESHDKSEDPEYSLIRQKLPEFVRFVTVDISIHDGIEMELGR